MQKLKTLDLIYIGVFGSLWGVVEISLGTVLHVFNFPSAGSIILALGLLVALSGRTFVPKSPSILYMGLIAAILKTFSVGGFIFSPTIAIIVEASLAELVLLLMGDNKISYLTASCLTMMYTLLHPLLVHGLLFGKDIYGIYYDLTVSISKLLNLKQNPIWLIVLILLCLKFILGILIGNLAWSLRRELEARGISKQKSSKTKFLK